MNEEDMEIAMGAAVNHLSTEWRAFLRSLFMIWTWPEHNLHSSVMLWRD